MSTPTDMKHTHAEGAHLSGGARRVLAVAASLAVSNRPVYLREAITGIDPDALQCVLRALAHAGDSRSFEEPGQAHDEPR